MSISAGSIHASLVANTKSFVAGMRQASQAFQATTTTIQQGGGALSQLQSQFNSVTTTIGGFTGALKNIKNVAVGSLAAIGAYNIIPSIFQAAKSAFIDFNQQVDQSTIALTSFLGSAGAADKMVKELQQFAAKTPFQFQDLLGTVQSMMALGVESKDVIPRMQAIGDAAAAMGGTPEVMHRIQRALGQIQAKGRVQSEELLQLAEAGIPAYQYLADALGTTTAEMLGDLKKGTVGAQVAIEAVLDGMARDFGGMMEEQSKTMMGALSTVKDYVQITAGAITRPLFDAFRNTFVAIANFLGSEASAAGAKKFAAAIAEILTAVQSGLIEAFNALKEPLTTIVKTIIDMVAVAIKLGKAIAPIATMIAGALVGALVAVAKVIAPVIGAIGSLVKFLSELKFVIEALAVILVSKWILGLIQAQMATDAFGGKAIALVGKLKIMQWQFMQTFSTMKGFGMSSFTAFKIAAQATFTSVAAGARAMGVAIASSLGPMILITIAVMAATKLFQAFSNRNKDAKERVSELTQAIKEQSDAITGNSSAIEEFMNKSDALSKVLLETGENGDRFATAMSYLNTTDDAATTIAKLQENTEGASRALLESTIGAGAAADALLDYVNAADKVKPEDMADTLRNMVVTVMEDGVEVTRKFTEAEIQAALALEELQDQAENTDLNALAKSQIENIAKTNNFVKALRDQALKTVEARKATDKSITTDNYYIKVRDELAVLIAKYNAEQERAAKAADKLANAEYNMVDAIITANGAAKDGVLKSEDYTKALFGQKLGALQNARGIRTMNMELGDLLEGVKNTKGDFEALRGQGYKLFDQLMENSTAIHNMGGTIADTVFVMEQQVEQFKTTAIAAGYEKKEVDALLESLGILSQIKSLKTKLEVDAAQAAQTLKEYIQILARLNPKTEAYAKLEEEIANLNAIIAESKRTAITTGNAFNALGNSKKSAAAKTATLADAANMLKDRIKDQKRAVIEAKQALQDYARESASSLYKTVSVGSVYDRYKASQEKKEQIIERNKQIRAQMEADRVAKQREDARKLVDDKNKLIDAENRLIELQNQFAESVGDSVSAVLSFSNISSQQSNAISEYQNALAKQGEAQAKANEAQAEYQELATKVATIQQKLSAATGRYARRVLGEELVKAQEDAQGALEKYTEAQQELASATNATNEAQSKQITFLQGLEQQASRALKFGSIIERLSAAGLSKDALSQIASAGAEVGTTMGEELLAGGIEAISKANEFSKQIIDEGKRVTGLFSQTLKERLEYEVYEDKPVYEELGKEVGETFAQSLANQHTKAKDFTEKVKKLISMGLRGTQLEEVLNAGVDAGTEIADALIASGAETIQQSVAIQDELKNLSKKFGDELVPYFDQTGVMLAEALLKALQQKLANLPSLLKGKSGEDIQEWIDNLDTEIADMTRDIANTITGTPQYVPPATITPQANPDFIFESLKDIPSLQKEMTDWFASGVAQTFASNYAQTQEGAQLMEILSGTVAQSFVGDGGGLYEATMFAKGGIVTAPTLGIVGEAGAEAIIPLNQLGNFGGNNYTITVNAGMGTNGSQVGAQIVEAIKKYEKSNGTRWRS